MRDCGFSGSWAVVLAHEQSGECVALESRAVVSISPEPAAPRGAGLGAPVAPRPSLASGLVTPSLASVGMAAGAATVERSAEGSAALVATNGSRESAAASVAVPVQLSLPGSAEVP